MTRTYNADWADDAAVLDELDDAVEAQALQAIEDAAGGPVTCGWFACCDQQAVTTVAHPVLGYVPCCEGCAVRASS